MKVTWSSDLLADFEQLTIALPEARKAPEEGPHPLVATLVRPLRMTSHETAVLYVHGWNDYFFQSHMADFFTQRKVGFYALDLRRYGRSLREGHYCGYVDDLTEYGQELSAAVEIMRAAGTKKTVLLAHSTGGLAGCMVAASHTSLFDGVALNSPWLAQASPQLRTVVPLMGEWGKWEPYAALRGQSAPGVYGRSIYSGWDGTWDYDLKWKSTPHFRRRLGWLRAVAMAQESIADGLCLEVPTWCATAERSSLNSSDVDDQTYVTDTVLDVESIRRAAVGLARELTLVQIVDGMHDLALSAPRPRAAYFSSLWRWMRAYDFT